MFCAVHISTGSCPFSGYDGGDCCECTCTSGPKFSCSSSDFVCVDPSASCVETVVVGNAIDANCTTVYLSDGDCDPSNNNEECGESRARMDCCHCTVKPVEFCFGVGCFCSCLCSTRGCGETYPTRRTPVRPDFARKQSETLLKEHTPARSINANPPPTGVVNEWLLSPNVSGYDGGDCCQCTCVSTTSFTCGDNFHGGFQCIDPSAPCVADDDFTSNQSDEESYTEYTTSSSCVPDVFSDGACDLSNNNEDCGALRSGTKVAYDVYTD